METKKLLMNWRGAPTRHVGRALRCCLTALLMFFAVQGAWGFAANPEITLISPTDKQLSFTSGHVEFTWRFFDYHLNNSGYISDVYLTVNGDNVFNLTNAFSAIKTARDSEEDVIKNSHWGKNDVVFNKQQEISTKWGSVTVKGKNLRGANKTCYCYMDMEVIFHNLSVDETIKIGIKGTWKDKEGTEGNSALYLDNFSKPNVTMPSSITITRTGNGRATVSSPDNVQNTSGWQYCFDFYKEEVAGRPTSNQDNAYQLIAGKNTTTNGSYHGDAVAGATSYDFQLVVDNYKPDTIYPVIGRWGGSPAQVFYKKYAKIILPGYPKPKNIIVSASNSYNKHVTISWERDAYNSESATNGTWVITRKKTGQPDTEEKLGEVANGTYSYTDTKGDLVYGTTYTYMVNYQPQEWKVNSESEAGGLSGYVRYKLNRDFAFTDESAEDQDGNIVFSWSHNSIQDASSSKTYKLFVQRSTDYGTTWEDLRTDNITSPSITGGSYTDSNIRPHKSYQYRLKIYVQDADVYSAVRTTCVTNGSTLTGFTASRGNYSTSVKLNWTVNQVGTDPVYFTLQRRPLGNTNESAWADIHTTSGTANSYSYDDNTAQPGSFNEYNLKIFDIYNDTLFEGKSLQTDGFCLATGVVSGRIIYGSNTAVEGAKITLKATNAEGDETNSNRSLYFDGSVNSTKGGSGITCTTDSISISNMFGGDFTIQTWINPDASKMTANANYILFDLTNTIGLFINKSSTGYWLCYSVNNSGVTSFNKSIDTNKWTHLTWTYSKSSEKLTLYATQNCTSFKDKAEITSITIAADKLAGARSFAFGNWQNLQGSNPFPGYLDEIRIFNRCLSEEEILKNCNHTLNGSEEGLQVYYPLDEGMAKQTVAYDFSKQNGVSNGHHAWTGTAARSEQVVVPSKEQLSLMTYTDKNGNYMLRGIPFSGEGTSYTIRPSFGVHKFSPENEARFFSLNSLTYSGVNFTDDSSFPVSGTVYYDGTTIPVEGVYLYVDGNLASCDGEPVMTDNNGHYKIDVPIGDHFISVKKNGHIFEDDGRAPADPSGIGLRYTFEDERKNLDFYDKTHVTVAGRVCGGDIENDKPLGLRNSVANIGQAKLTLTYSSTATGTTYINAKKTTSGEVTTYSNNTAQLDYDASTPNVNSQAYVMGGKNKITIVTDPVTGEWAAQLLPLKYEVESVVIDSNQGLVFNNLPEIDASNPQVEYTDSLKGVEQVFKYCASGKIRYKMPATFVVKEHEDGSFGEKSIKVKDLTGDEVDVPLYTVGNDGKVTYRFGHPVYKSFDTYTYNLRAYERYVNKDDSNNPVYDEVPLADKEVTIANQYASSASVRVDNGEVVELEDNKLTLDSLGQAEYSFRVGFPNIQSPYTRGLSISYTISGETPTRWYDTCTDDVKPLFNSSGSFEAIALGSLPTGNDFVTKAPDELLMVLRDPPGSNSFATFGSGTTVSKENTLHVNVNNDMMVNNNTKCGVETKTSEGIGVAFINELNAKADLNVGVETHIEHATDNSWSHVTTTTRDISTSEKADFVGTPGDLFIGASKNRTFGATHNVTVVKEDNDYVLTLKDGISIGDEFDTFFTLSQFNIENIQIPAYLELIDKLLNNPVDNISSVARPEIGEDPIYVSKVPRSDERFGSENTDKNVWGDAAKEMSNKETGIIEGPSYYMILPKDNPNAKNSLENAHQDLVSFYNQQIKGWKRRLAQNEEAKVKAFREREKYIDENYSFDGGASITYTHQTDTTDTHTYAFTEEIKVGLTVSAGFLWNGVGNIMTLSDNLTECATTTVTKGTTNTKTLSYTLAEEGEDDYLTVDVLKDPFGYGPIFHTRGGATSCPYEDVVVTKYYEPGTVISDKTVQIEKPEIEAVNPLVSGIPAGAEGVFKMYIRNNSDTNEDRYYDLNVVDDTNPDGLEISIDGANVNKGRTILVPAGKTITKTFTVKQKDLSVLNYEGIQLRIASQCQPNNTGVFHEIADTTEMSFYFQPTCSDIHLKSTHRLVNTETETTQVLSISGYNHSMESLTGVRLQRKGQADADFRTIQEYTKDAERLANDVNLLPLPSLQGTNTLDFIIDLREPTYSDQTYTFRAITVCEQDGAEVNNESEEIEIVRDMTRPQLIATPAPSSGILGSGDDLLITFNENIQGGMLSKPVNFLVTGVLNESEVTHDVALSLNGENAAKTDATMDLSGKSFSASMWVNYAEDGRLLMHGTADNNFTVAIESGKLAVTVAGTKVTSEESMPANKWVYLNVAYDAETNIVSAGYAMDASEKMLFSQATVPAYEGNGPVMVGGNNFVGKVQELSLWNDFRSLAEAQADMYTTKSQFTNGLIGYWQMDEGHGDVATDRARSRNLTLPSVNAWWVNGDNYALTLDGTKAAAANIGALNTTSSEDYLVEAWFKADEQQSGVASILSTIAMDLRLNEQGKMELALNGSPIEVMNKDLRDGQWHHVAVNVLKSTNGSGIIYVDGQQRKQISASAMPALYGDKLMLGSHRTSVDGQGLYTYDQMLKGAIDEVRIWKSRRTADVIKNNMYARVKSDEPGLVGYYPLERFGLDTNNQTVTTSNLEDATEKQGGELTFFIGGAECSMENTAALKRAPSLKNVDFSFVASERQIKVNLEEQPYKQEGCNIYITVKEVMDMHGNAAQPITWSVYVQQNNLRWQENDLAVTKEGAEEATFTATIENRGSQSENWSLSGMPIWLSADTEAGTLMPLASQKLTFTVAGSLPIGTYETAVYLTGSQNINAPLNITVTSEGDAPNWTVTPGKSTMNVIGVLTIDDVQSSDPKDMVAAFRGQECVGVAHPQYFSRYDSYMVLLNIYGDANAELTYKAYDASTGTVYPSVSVNDENANTFGVDKVVGSFDHPTNFVPLNEIEQDLSMDYAAWKWFSLYAMPKVNDASVVFKDAKDVITTITDGSYSLISWDGVLSFDPANMYKLNAIEPYVETLVGEPVDPADIDITLDANGWTWIGYPCQAINSLDAALANVADEGDMVKNQTSFSVYSGGKWEGTLTAMQPGDGYIYKNNGDAKTFHFTKPTVSGKMNAPRRAASLDSPLSSLLFKDNMTMIAVVMDGDELVENAQVSVYSGAELRAFSGEAIRINLSETEAISGEANRIKPCETEAHFLTIGGNGEAETLTFVVTTEDGEYMLSQTMTFQTDAMKGSLAQPYVLQLGGTTAIDLATGGMGVKSVQLYDNAGRLVRSDVQKVYTKDDLKQLPAGIYYQQVVYDNGMTRVQKLMR